MKLKKNEEKINFYFRTSFLFIFSFAVLYFSIPSVLAQEIDFTFKQGVTSDLRLNCFNNGTFCSSATECNVTIQDTSNGRIVIDNVVFDNNVNYYNYTLEGIRWNDGIYKGVQVCKDGTQDGADDFFFQITPSGKADNSLQNIILLGFTLIFSGGLVLFGLNKQDPTITLFGAIGLTLLGLYSMLNGISIYRNTFTQGISVIVIFLGGYVGVRTAVETL